MSGLSTLKSIAICIGLGGVPFSLCLYRLGEDIVSANFLAYLLRATLPFILLVAIVVFVYGSRYTRAIPGICLGLSLLMCVPLEILAYVVSNWQLRRHDLGVPFFVLLLSIWAITVGLTAALLVWTVRVLKNRRRDVPE